VSSFYCPRLSYEKYQPLVEHLGARTGRAWTLVVARSREAAVADLCEGRVALAYLGPFGYVRAHERCGAEPLARLRTGGQVKYHSYVLVRADSPLERLEDLRGRRFGFGAALSTTSHLVPRAMLQEAGLRPGRDVGCRYFEHDHDAARAVLLGDVDACAVRDLTGELFMERGLRRLALSSGIPGPPLVLAPGTAPELRDALRDLLLSFPGPARPAGSRAGWDPELAGGFAPVVDSDYDSVRRLAAEVLGPGAERRAEAGLVCR
jgi:phosphonate transport system substrate-binding protein